MGLLVSGATALVFNCLLALLFGVSSVFSQDLRERDALCNTNGCFVVYFQRKTFLDSWRACKEKGGNLATVKRKEHAGQIASLLSTADLRHSRTEVRVWIGLQRQPRQCSTTHPLRGFSWTTGDQDTEYTSWQREDSPLCSVPSCVLIGYSTLEQNDNFKWMDASCSVAVDGYLCHYAYKGMCAALWSEGEGSALYSTPFDLVSTLLTHIPLGSVASVPCSAKEEQSAACMLKEDGSAGWSRDFPLCSKAPASHSWCDHENGGCDHFCRSAGVHFYCECAGGYLLADDGQTCELTDACEDAPCEFECLPLSEGYRCACPEGYMLDPQERGCLDVDECLQSPCEQICVNAPGTFECQCRNGYQVDEQGECEDVDECMDEPCEHACENTPGSLICHCHLGYSPMPEDSTRCQDIDECRIPGTCEQMCVNYDGTFQCYCKEDYELMPDHYSCRKRGEGDSQSAVTPPFSWLTKQPGPVWDAMDYDWNPEQGHTDWPLEEEQSLDWLTDPPRLFNSDVIWVTSAPQEELPDLVPDPPTQQPERDEGPIEDGGTGWLEWVQRSQSDPEVVPLTTHASAPPTTKSLSEPEVVPLTTHTSAPPTTKSLTTIDWYEDNGGEETVTALPSSSNSTVSDGAGNWWMVLTSARPEVLTSARPEAEETVMDHDTLMSSNNHDEGEDEPSLVKGNSTIPAKGGADDMEITTSLESVVPSQFAPSQPPLVKDRKRGDIVDSVQEDKGQTQNRTGLLVGLLVPICIFIVVMVTLGIVYCTRCADQPQNKNAPDCYHWIPGAPNHSTEVKTNV
ncbi:CD248 molecule, endosialin a [Brachionichthys hirsutus]|uniref:CD248 molecule, endosialin a n=1 Tax=Brachionichthys hirsutus TaxID=412623 RepID=UPI003604457E